MYQKDAEQPTEDDDAVYVCVVVANVTCLALFELVLHLIVVNDL